MEDLTRPLPLAAVTLPARLKDVGYATGMVGKWHLGAREGFTPLDRGFDEFFGFLGGGHIYLPRPEAKGEYNAPILRNRQRVDEHRYLTDAFSEEAAAFVDRQRNATKPFFLYLAFNAVHAPLEATGRYLDRFPAITDRNRRIYAAMLGTMDDGIGRVLEALERIGQKDRTLVIFHNDNGGPTRATPSTARGIPRCGARSARPSRGASGCP